MRNAILTLAVLTGILRNASVGAAADGGPSDDLNVLATSRNGAAPKQMLTRYLKQQAYSAFERRAAALAKIKEPADVAARQRRMRSEFLERIGGLPERTPLNAKVVGVIDGDRYRIEKLIYESRPRHYVTASLYVPKGKGPFPAVLIPSGHSRTAKAASYNQQTALILVHHGIVALCYDPIGQGERSQILDKDGKPVLGSTTEHTLVGVGCILVGRSTASYRIWDGMRSIDYLVSRKDIDSKRIGVTGCSGGGTLSSYLMALDDRIRCAAPSCYLTTLHRLIDTIGPQDAEQNVFGQIDIGMDHADYVTMRAPSPVLMLVATRDFFDIDGAWHTFREAKRVFTTLGHPDRVDLVETDTKHGYPKMQREAMLRWMRRRLMSVDKSETEPELELRTAKVLTCSPKGQVMLMPNARSVMDFNVELDHSLAESRRESWKGDNFATALATVREAAGIRPLRELPKAKTSSVGKVRRDGCVIEKIALSTEPGITLPALLFRPKKPSGKRILYLHADGKHVDAARGGPIEKLAAVGHTVLAVDVRGVGETGPKSDNRWGGGWDHFFLSYLLGRSLLGMRAEDVLQSARYLSELDNPREPVPVSLIAKGVLGPPALHAAALERNRFASVELSGSLNAWSDLLASPTTPGQMVNAVHGALKTYDLPDLVGAIGEKKVTIRDPLQVAAPESP